MDAPFDFSKIHVCPKCKQAGQLLPPPNNVDDMIVMEFHCSNPECGNRWRFTWPAGDTSVSQQHQEHQRQQLKRQIHSMMQGKHVVIVYKPGGRIAKERRYDSDSDDFTHLREFLNAIALYVMDNSGVGPHLIGRGVVGLMPWEKKFVEPVTEESRLKYMTPVRIADVIENPRTGITTIIMESS